MENELTLSEQLLLLAVRPEKGGISGWAYRTLDFSLIGAVLLDLNLLKKVVIKNKRVEVLQGETAEEPYRYVLEKLSRSSKPRRITTWMGSWYISKKHLRRELYNALVQKRAVKLEERRFLFFRWKKPFLTSGGPAFRTVDQIKKIINQGAESPADIYLLFLVEVCGLMRRIYPDRFQRKRAKEKISQIKESGRMQEHVRQAMETANAIRSAVNASAAAAAASHA